jgi:hypothetical protein
MRERYFYLDDNQKALIGTGLTAAAGIGTALAGKSRKQLSDVENRCGKKPRRKGDARNKWEQCAYSNTNQQPVLEKKSDVKSDDSKKNNKKILLISGGILTVLVIGFFIFKSRKK